MSDDLLKQYTSALKAEYDGATASPEATRARVIRALAERRPRRARWWSVGIPALVLLGGSTAWAASNGQLTEIWERATVALGIAETPAELPSTARSARSSRSGRVEQANPIAAAEPAPAVADARLEPASTPQPNSAPELEGRAAEERASLPLPTPSAAPVPSTLSPTAEHAELERKRQEDAAAIAAYKAGHDAHFSRSDCNAALLAYDAYLARYPRGSFVLEAKYNRALCLVQNGQLNAARSALLPFARGDHGQYRRAQAGALIEALNSAAIQPAALPENAEPGE